MPPIPWERFDVVVFDVDGTLYDQGALRRAVAGDLLAHLLSHPGDRRILPVLRRFRRVREDLAREEAEGVAELQYQRTAEALGLSRDEVERLVRRWMHDEPLRHLRKRRFRGVGELLKRLRESGTAVAAFSDFPVETKLRALELEFDLEMSSEDTSIDRFKPHPAGLHVILGRIGVAAGRCLVIGDRDDRDGACARRAGATFLRKRSRSWRRKHWEFYSYPELLETSAL